MIAAASLLFILGIGWATVKPFRSSAGVQMVPQAHWSGGTGDGGVGIAGIYYNDDGGMMVRKPDNTEFHIPTSGGGGSGTVTSVAAGTGMSFSTITTTGSVAVDTAVVATTSNSLTMTNKTLTAPVLGGSITGTYTLAGTPTITSPTISGPTFSGSAIGTYTIAGTPTLGASVTTTDGTYSIGDSTHRLTNVAAKNIIGGTAATAVINDSVGTELHYGTAAIDLGTLGNNTIAISANTGVGYWLFTASLMAPDTDKTMAFGSTAKRVNQIVTLIDQTGGAVADQPTCDSTKRGAMFNVQATTGNGDIFQICTKGTADTYAWRTIVTAP